MGKQEIERAVSHGVALLNGEIPDTTIPYHDNVYILKQFLVAVLQGRITLGTPELPGRQNVKVGENGLPTQASEDGADND
jgi:hypothetical protein